MSEDLKQTPPASIESDAPSEYMRGYSDGLAYGAGRLAYLKEAFLQVSALAAEAAEALTDEAAR